MHVLGREQREIVGKSGIQTRGLHCDPRTCFNSPLAMSVERSPASTKSITAIDTVY